MALTNLSDQSMTITTEELEALEARVRGGLASFREVGNALIEIRDRGGYKRRGFKTFEEYCDRVFGESDRHARRLITGAMTADKVEKVLGAGQAPRNEGVARELEKIADDPVVLEKVQKRLGAGKKPLSVATATAEKVAEVVAIITGKERPARPEKPAAGSKANGAAQPAPTLPAEGIAELQAVLTSARAFLKNHAWLKDDADAARIVSQLDGGLVELDGMLAAAYARPGARPSKAPSKAEVAGPPRCPSCKAAIRPGDTFCNNCGTVLE